MTPKFFPLPTKVGFGLDLKCCGLAETARPEK